MSSAASAPSVKHLLFLDGVRGLASLYVLIHHAVLFHHPDLEYVLRDPLWRLTSWGRDAVTVFFVLSGCVLMLPVAREGQFRGGLRKYAARRAWRILPPYYAALAYGAVCLLVLPLPAWYRSLMTPITVGGWLSHLALVHSLYGPWYFQIHGILWSVGSEWILYWLLPLVLIPLYRRVGIAGVLAVCAVYAASPRLFPLHHMVSYSLLMFAFGLAAACLIVRPARAVDILLVGLLAIGLVGVAGGSGRVVTVHDAAAGLATMLLLVALARWPSSAPRRLLESRPLAFLAGFSYSLYLTHPPILATIQELATRAGFAHRMIPWINLAAGVPLSLAFAWAFAQFFERPFTGSRQPGATGAVAAGTGVTRELGKKTTLANPI